MGELTSFQEQALDYVGSLPVLSAVCDPTLQAWLSSRKQVAVHFHPDRIARSGLCVAEGLAQEGVFRTQFETGISAGALGGDRQLWEDRLFGGAYRDHPLSDRPRYGSLQLFDYLDGPSPRFGSCYLLLREEVLERSTLTYLGSQEERALEQSGTWLRPANLLRALAESEEIQQRRAHPRNPGRALDCFVEAQIHGSLELGRDVEAIVADPAFRNFAPLQQLADSLGLELGWHGGFVLAVEEVPDDFRGPLMPPLARRVAPCGRLDVAAVGRAEAALRRQPLDWAEFGTFTEVLQGLKQLWHVLVEFGQPV